MRGRKGILIIFLIVLIFSRCNNSGSSDISVSQPGIEKGHDHLKPMSATDSAAYISRKIDVKGDVENELTLTVDSLKKMKTITLDEFNVVCQFGVSDKTEKPKKTRTGVLLKNILERAKIRQLNHKDRNFYIVARATDNYKATFSWAELFNNPTGENTYVLFEEGGMPIENSGEMILVCANDIKTGPRHVKWLKSIEVRRVN